MTRTSIGFLALFLAVCAFLLILLIEGRGPRPWPSSGSAFFEGVAVSGECVREVEDDRVSLILRAESVEPTAAKASENVQKSYNELKRAVENLKLKDFELETTEYNVHEEVDWNEGKRILRGYRASLGLKVSTSEMARIGEVVSLAGEMNIGNVSSFQSYLSDEKLREEQAQCYEVAVQDARAKAQRIAQSAERTLGDLLSAVEQQGHGSSSPPIQPTFEAKSLRAGMLSDVAPPQMEAQRSRVRVRIETRFGFRH